MRRLGSARRKGAAEGAVADLERALREPPADATRTEVLSELGMDEMLVSGSAAAEHLREALRGLSDPGDRAYVAAMLARALMFTAPPQDAVEVAAGALAEIPAELVDERQALRALELMACSSGPRISRRSRAWARSRSRAREQERRCCPRSHRWWWPSAGRRSRSAFRWPANRSPTTS